MIIVFSVDRCCDVVICIVSGNSLSHSLDAYINNVLSVERERGR